MKNFFKNINGNSKSFFSNYATQNTDNFNSTERLSTSAFINKNPKKYWLEKSAFEKNKGLNFSNVPISNDLNPITKRPLKHVSQNAYDSKTTNLSSTSVLSNKSSQTSSK